MSLPCKSFRALGLAAALAPAAWACGLTIPAASAMDRLASVSGENRGVPPKRMKSVAVPSLGAAEPMAAASASAHETVAVMVDRAKIIRLPERTQTVIVGNPGIADVSLQKNGIVVLTGKSYGLTNLIALDATGAVLVESTVSVQAATEAVVVVQRGMERESYSCTPRCQPSMLLGDSTKYFGEVTAQATQRNATATQK